MSNIEVITPNWPLSKKVQAFSTTRFGGVSQAQFDSLNLGGKVGDNLEHVAINRKLVVEQLGLPEMPRWLNQTSGSAVIRLPLYNPDGTQITGEHVLVPELEKVLEVDACYTNQPNTVCVVLTADCVPILLCNAHETIVCAIHAGWKGIVAGVVQNSLAALIHDFPDQEWYAWLGPSIGPQSFVVGADVLYKFSEIEPNFIQYFRTYHLEENKWLGDLPSICSVILQKFGVKKTHIYNSEIDTVTDSRFYSYRAEQVTGRFATLIWLAK